MTPDEIGAIAEARHKAEEERRQEDWERTRLHATLVMQPHCKSRLNPKRLLPFPWESHKERKPSGMTWEEQRRRAQFLEGVSSSASESSSSISDEDLKNE